MTINNYIPSKFINIFFDVKNLKISAICAKATKQFDNFAYLRIDTFSQSSLLGCLEFKKGWLIDSTNEEETANMFLKIIDNTKRITKNINEELKVLSKCAKMLNEKAFEEFTKKSFHDLQEEHENNHMINESECHDIFLLPPEKWAHDNTYFVGCFNDIQREDLISDLAQHTDGMIANNQIMPTKLADDNCYIDTTA